MKFIFFLALVALSTAKILTPTVKDDHSFYNFLQKHDSLIVSFGSDKCPTCQQWDPAYEHFAEGIANNKTDVDVASFNCEASNLTKLVCHSYQVTELPTVIYFKKTRPLVRFAGDLSADNLAKWINTILSHKPYEVIKTPEDYSHYTKEVLPTLDYHGTLFVINGNVTNNNITAFLDAKSNSLPVIMVLNDTLADTLVGKDNVKGNLYGVRGGSPYVVFNLLTYKESINPHVIGRAFTVANRPYDAQMGMETFYNAAFVAQRANEPILLLGTVANATKEQFQKAVDLSRILDPLTFITIIMVPEPEHDRLIRKEDHDNNAPFALYLDMNKGSYFLQLDDSKNVTDQAKLINTTQEKLKDGSLKYEAHPSE